MRTAPLYVEDVENLLHESLLLTFNTEIEDGSIEEVSFIYIRIKICYMIFFVYICVTIEALILIIQVAEQLMILHEEYLH